MLYKVLTAGPLLMALVCFHYLVHQARGQTEDDENLKTQFELLLKYYKDNKGSIKSDCKLENSEDDDGMHHHWGTISSLAFLSESEEDKLLPGEKRIDRKKLRKFLARVGYLKRPGSFLFLDKQTSTMRLLGCKDNSAWRQHGEKDSDKEFQEYHYTGSILKTMAPNPNNYLHMYVCYSVDDKCSHTFYVISKPLPELPLGLQVSEGKASGEYDFTCTMPYCRMKDCEILGTDKKYPRRLYPPYQLKWDVPNKMKKILGINGENSFIGQNDPVLNKLKKAEVEMKWESKILTDKKANMHYGYSYKKFDSNTISDGFGDEFESIGDAEEHKLHTRIIVTKADNELQSGSYECLIIDANGVVSTPSKIFYGYRGIANIHVMPLWQLWVPYVVALVCCSAVAVIILVCPAKLEHDDGVLYTKDELVVPAETDKHRVT